MVLPILIHIVSIRYSSEDISRGDGEADEPWIMTVRGADGARALHAHTHASANDEDKRRNMHDEPGKF